MPSLLAWVGAALGKWEQHYPQSVLPILASSRKGTPHAASPSEVNRFHPPLCLLTWALTFLQSSATCGGWAGLQALRRPLRESSLATTPQSSTDLHRFLSLSFISAPFQKKKKKKPVFYSLEHDCESPFIPQRWSLSLDHLHRRVLLLADGEEGFRASVRQRGKLPYILLGTQE